MSTSMKVLASAIVALVLALPSATYAYTLVFKDGSTLVVENKYRVEGDRVLATLLSGTETFFALVDVDLEKTDALNRNNVGSAFVLDGQNVRPLEQDAAPPPQTLADLVRGGGANEGIFAKPTARASVRRTPTGNLDYFSLPGDPLPSNEASQQITRLLRRHGVAAAVRMGSEAGRILVLLTTNTRGEVFSALTGTAGAMVDLVDQMPDVQFLELAMSANNRTRAGMFLLGYEDAVALAEGKILPETFFLENVLF